MPDRGIQPSTLKWQADLKMNKEPALTCPKCGRAFMTPQAATRHLINYHGVDRDCIAIHEKQGPVDVAGTFKEIVRTAKKQFGVDVGKGRFGR